MLRHGIVSNTARERSTSVSTLAKKAASRYFHFHPLSAATSAAATSAAAAGPGYKQLLFREAAPDGIEFFAAAWSRRI